MQVIFDGVSGLDEFYRAARAVEEFKSSKPRLGKQNGTVFRYRNPDATFLVWKTKTTVRCVKD